jgi:tryptophan-rich sensory protein
MAATSNLLVSAVLLVLAVMLGYLAYQRFGNGVGLWADLSQLVGGILYFFIFAGLLFLGGAFRVIAFVMLIVSTAIILRKQEDARARDWRSDLKGGGS